MKELANLFYELDATNKTNEKVSLLKAYFSLVSNQDKVWTIALFSGRKPAKPVNSTLLKAWAVEYANIPTWLFEESYNVVGDLAETIALLLPEPATTSIITLTETIDLILSLSGMEENHKKQIILDIWQSHSSAERFVFNKLLTGSFRIGVSQSLMVAALAQFTNIEKNKIFHRIMGNWDPQTITFEELIFSENIQDDLSKPYPFCLAYPIENTPEVLGNPDEWQAEWKWDGIRSQLIKRAGNIFIWSRGEELITNKFPEIMEMASQLPDNMVLDGEILPYIDKPLPFNVLQTRITRKNLSAKILKEAPVIFMLYDVLEWQSEDIRMLPLSKRTALGAALVDEQKHNVLKLSTPENFATWDELAILRTKSREMDAEGFMIKRKNSIYQVGRKRGDWWKWKIAPLSIDAVLIYAQKGHGRRADLYTDYTFAVWNEDKLIPFAKAYSGLSDIEIKKVDEFIKKNTKEKFGPVRTVNPELVFEIGFEGIQNSPRHKSGIAVRFPRILRWRIDKKKEEANTLEDLKSMLQVYGVTNLIV